MLLASYHAILEKIPTHAQLIVVSKKQSMEKIRVLLEAGHRHFGENYVEEAQEKWPDLLRAYPDIILHGIGPIQSKKANAALALFHYIHTVDRISLVDALHAACEKKPELFRERKFFIQVNTGEETQKAGVFPEKLPEILAYTAAKKLPISGLMCLPPAQQFVAPHFAFLAHLQKKYGLALSSMGMSQDFEIALKFGADFVRVGSAIFGER